MGYPRRRDRFLSLPAARPRWSCPCPSFPPPKRSRRGDRQSPTPEKTPVPRHLPQIAHLQQCLGHLCQPLRLLAQKREELRRLRSHIGMLRGKQLQLRLLHLRGKAAQGLESASADEIGEDAAEQRYRRRNVPVGGAEAPLHPIDDDGQLLVGRYELRVKARRFAIIQDHRAAAL